MQETRWARMADERLVDAGEREEGEGELAEGVVQLLTQRDTSNVSQHTKGDRAAVRLLLSFEHCLAERLILLDCKLYVHDDGALYEGPRTSRPSPQSVVRTQHLREREERSETSGPQLGSRIHKAHLRFAIRVCEEEELVDQCGQLVGSSSLRWPRSATRASRAAAG